MAKRIFCSTCINNQNIVLNILQTRDDDEEEEENLYKSLLKRYPQSCDVCNTKLTELLEIQSKKYKLIQKPIEIISKESIQIPMRENPWILLILKGFFSINFVMKCRFHYLLLLMVLIGEIVQFYHRKSYSILLVKTTKREIFLLISKYLIYSFVTEEFIFLVALLYDIKQSFYYVKLKNPHFITSGNPLIYDGTSEKQHSNGNESSEKQNKFEPQTEPISSSFLSMKISPKASPKAVNSIWNIPQILPHQPWHMKTLEKHTNLPSIGMDAHPNQIHWKMYSFPSKNHIKSKVEQIKIENTDKREISFKPQSFFPKQEKTELEDLFDKFKFD
jgi:hypothetical protein